MLRAPRPAGRPLTLVCEVALPEDDDADVSAVVDAALANLRARFPQATMWLPQLDGLRVWRVPHGAGGTRMVTRIAVIDPESTLVRAVEYVE